MIPLFAPRAHDWGARNLANCTISRKNFAKLCATCLLQFIPKCGILLLSKGMRDREHRIKMRLLMHLNARGDGSVA